MGKTARRVGGAELGAAQPTDSPAPIAAFRTASESFSESSSSERIGSDPVNVPAAWYCGACRELEKNLAQAALTRVFGPATILLSYVTSEGRSVGLAETK